MKISVITCTYNSQEYLPQTIESVRNQTFKDFEHIFIDAGSTDNTLEIIKTYKKEFPSKVKVFYQKPCGISSAMNCGVEKAEGEAICHLHSDDLFFDENVLATIDKSFKKSPNLEWCYGKIVIINSNGSEYNRENPPEFSKDKLLARNFIPHPATFIKRDFFNELGGFSSYKYAMDYDLWLRAAKISKPVKIDHFLTKFRRHSGGTSTKSVIPTLKEDYQIRLANTESRMQRFVFCLDFKYRITKFKLARLLGRV
jgi:glycosyltransferase involved in cell wall biosynthesis